MRDGRMSRLAGKVALVTGGGRGIGLSLVQRLAAEGARLVVNDLDPEPAEAAAKAIRDAGGEAIAVPGSVTSRDFAPRFVGAALDAFGDIHILVNNAGYVWNGPLHKIGEEQWDAMQDVHLKAPFRILKELRGGLGGRDAHPPQGGQRLVCGGDRRYSRAGELLRRQGWLARADTLASEGMGAPVDQRQLRRVRLYRYATDAGDFGRNCGRNRRRSASRWPYRRHDRGDQGAHRAWPRRNHS